MSFRISPQAAIFSVLAGVYAVSSPKTLADLVLDDDAPSAQKVDDRDNLRKVVKTSQKAEEAAASESLSMSTAPVVVEASQEAAPIASKSDLLRRARMREEMKNEDLLQQRLEELRFRDEQKRSAKLLKQSGLDEDDSAAAKNVGTAAPVMQEQVVAPVAAPAASYQMAPAPQYQQTQLQPISNDAVKSSQSSAASVSTSMSEAPSEGKFVEEKRSGIAIIPHVGFPFLKNSSYDFESRYAAGLSLGFDVSDYVAVEVGYTYSDMGVRLGDSVANYWAQYYGGSAQAFRTLDYRQNVIDMTAKLYFVNNEARIRPFVGGGAGYSLGYVNYDQNTINFAKARGLNLSDAYELKSFLGVLEAGIDFKISKNLSMGAVYKYYNTLSSSENDSLYYGGFVNNGNVITSSANSQKDYVSGTIRDSNLQVVQVGATFYF